MSKRITSKRYYGNRDKYSVCYTPMQISFADEDGTQIIVPASTTEGMRKVKHLNISFAGGGNGNYRDFYWAIVYVPNGYAPNPLNVPETGNFYDPPQFVMSAGVFDSSAGPNRIYSRVSRNLNAGDAIYLVVKRIGAAGAQTDSMNAVASYAITLQ